MMTRTYNSTATSLLAMAAVTVTFGGCAMKGDIRLLQDEMRAMAAQQDSLVAEFRVDASLTQDTLRTQSDQLFDFRGAISRQLQLVNQGLIRLEAIAGESQRGMASIRDQLANIRRTPIITTTTVVAGDSIGTSEGGGERLVGGGLGNPDQLWQVAQDQLDRGSLNAASRAFDQFIAEHPSDERVPDAHFYLADILTQQDRAEDALEAFQQIRQLFPTSTRVPMALYRIAVLQEQVGDVDEAKVTLERIMNTYPDAPIAMLAREKLRELG